MSSFLGRTTKRDRNSWRTGSESVLRFVSQESGIFHPKAYDRPLWVEEIYDEMPGLHINSDGKNTNRNAESDPCIAEVFPQAENAFTACF